MSHLSGAQRKYLRGLAHALKPVCQLGRQGLTESLVESVDEALGKHELIKVRFQDFKDQKKELSHALEERLGCERVGMIGHVAIFYRQAAEPQDRRIQLPARAARSVR